MEQSLFEIVSDKKVELKELKEELSDSLRELLEYQASELEKYSKQLEILNPKVILSRGYSISLGEDGKAIKSIKDVKENQTIVTMLEDGEISSKVVKVEGETK